MKPEEVKDFFEAEMKDFNSYLAYVLKGYEEQGVVPSPVVKDAAKTTYILAMLNKLKGAKNVGTRSKKTKSTSK